MAFFFDMSVNKEWEVEPGCCLPGLLRVYSLKMGSTLITCLVFCYMCVICLEEKKGLVDTQEIISLIIAVRMLCGPPQVKFS